MASLPLLARRLVIVTGKGGVGKSSVAAAIALHASRRGLRVLACEVNAHERIAPLLGSRPGGGRLVEASPGLHALVVTPAAALREYGLRVVRFQAVYDAVFENRMVRQLLRVAPGFAELVMLGKILHEARAEEEEGPRWDLVVLDAPATGHALQLLRVPQALLGFAPPGPLRHDAQWMRDLLADPARTGAVLVTLPEELPVNETLELDAELRRSVGVDRAALVVNAMPADRFGPADAERLGPLRAAPPPAGTAAEAAWLAARRHERAERAASRVRAGVRLPAASLPLLASPTWARPEIERLADALAAQGEPWLG